MKYYIVAGERSGDLHASNLIKSIKQRDSEAEFRGFGGDYMASAGAEIKVHIRDLAFMGFLEVLLGIFKITKLMKVCQRDVLDYHPDVLILVDYGGFNMKMAKWAKKNGVKVYYYISPKVWAWNTGRAKKLKATVDEMFVILPFEKEFFKQFDWDVHYVGNPVVDAVRAHVPSGDFVKKSGLPADKPIIALLPGSRKQELIHMLPMFAEVARQNRDLHFVVGAIKSLDTELYAPALKEPNISLVYDKTYDLYEVADAGIITSGTATLETALFGLPQVVAYRGSAISIWIAKKVAKIKFISLVNLIVGREVVRELIQEDMTPESMTSELRNLLGGERRDEVFEGYRELNEVLGDTRASDKAAETMLRLLRG
ncbi:lipid-A-disaccharide synthase [Fulvitalea axinellae]|uniref:Lipid-A-disaccharide synthase n=1 Tax=Fulvitalea axinellae TaxID=1182444 RepID=A0AAU9DCS3_9BACT|nr:lipid-A-disaccharide synthase [Fulvitalea axinellae]